MRRVSIAGVTGSIGTQTLDVLRSQPDGFELVAISAQSNVDLLIAIANEFKPSVVVIGDASLLKKLSEALPNCKVSVSSDGFEPLIEPADIVVNAIVGFAGLAVTLGSLSLGKRVALANKESLVAGGELVKNALLTPGSELIPIDSEHSAIFQCLRSGNASEIKEIVLTSSGGPFRGKSREQLQNVTVEEAVAHPKWNMGKKISIDSSTMFNKALEIIEAHELFDVDNDQIRVVIHPETIIHSAVTFTDGSTVAQLGPADMCLPISYALNYPRRSNVALNQLNWIEISSLTFEEPNRDVFKALEFASLALEKGGTASAILNAAKEVAVDAFIEGQLPWLAITDVVGETLMNMSVEKVSQFDQLVGCDQEARAYAEDVIRRIPR